MPQPIVSPLEPVKPGGTNQNQANTPKPVIFVSRAKELQIDNFTKEQWSGDHMTQPAGALKFSENMRVTDKPDEIEYIRKSGAYASHDVWEEPTMEAAMATITKMRVEKHTTRTFDNRLETKEIINPSNIDAATVAAATGPTRPIVNVPVEEGGR